MNYKLCRLCYKHDANSNIFKSDEQGLTYMKIKYCCKSISVRENDGLPDKICNSCDNELELAYQFLLRCEASDKKLRAIQTHTTTLPDSADLEGPKTEVKDEDDGNQLADDSFLFEESLESNIHIENKLTDHKVKNEKAEFFTFETSKKSVYIKDKLRKKNKPKKMSVRYKDATCSVCSRKCANHSSLTIHMRMHTNEKPFQCPSCDKKYKDGGTLKRHIERNHLLHRERRFICENCGKGFYSKRDILIHMRVHTGETPYSCSVCLKKFTQLSAMLRHHRRHDGKKTHVCSTCSKLFWTKEELKKHQSVHNDTKNFQCPICNVQFKQMSSKKKHMRNHIEPNRFVCNHCGQTFNIKGNLKSHISRKHSEKSGHCSLCCKNVSNMEIHMWKHTGQRPLKCEFCPSSFCEAKALALHINFKHKKTDRFKCTMDGCTRGFPSKPMMMYHIAKFHDMQTPYPCDRCSRGFYRKNDLSRHKIGTHKERLL